MGSASLLQSFPATPRRPVPPLWSQRLGAGEASRLWQRQRRIWWQLWANQVEAAPFLVLEADRNELPGSLLPPQALRVGDLLVFAEDATARAQLAASLRPLQRRSRDGLPRLCLQRLQSSQAVYWNAAALGVIAGQVAPLLERVQVGCLSLVLEGRSLRWQGEAASGDARAGLPGPAGSSSATMASGQPASQLAVPELPAGVPLPQDQLLELEGGSLDPLLAGLLERPMIRDPLALRYGLEGRQLEQARRSPFQLRLRPQSGGAFLASLELQLQVGESRARWNPVLERIGAALQAQGLQSGAAAAASPLPSATPLPGASPLPVAPPPSGAARLPAATPFSAAADASVWRRDDGVVVGGWQWVADRGRPSQLLFFLGPPPQAPQPINPERPFRPAAGQLWLRLRPDALAALGLLPEGMPALLQRASQIWMEVEPLPGAAASSISRLKGRLQVTR